MKMSSTQSNDRTSPLILPGLFSYAGAVKEYGNCVSTKTHSFGPVPKIVVSKVSSKSLRYKRYLERRAARIERLAYERRVLAALNKQPPKYEVEFFKLLNSVGVVCKGRLVTPQSNIRLRIKALNAFKRQWWEEHNVSHKVPPPPVYSHLKPGKVWSRDPAPRAPRWTGDSARSDSAQAGCFVASPTPVRSIILLTKLRSIIYALGVSRMSTPARLFALRFRRVVVKRPIHRCCRKTLPMVYGEMDKPDPHGEGESIKDLTAKNVVLQTHAEDSLAAPLETGTIVMRHLAGDDIETDYSALTERWLQVKTVTWSGSDTVGSEVVALDLPYDLFQDDSDKKKTECGVSTPSHIPFKIYQYWHGDLDIRIQANTNRFQQGQLQCSWFYLPTYDSKFSLRANIYSGSYTDHCLLDAASSNDMSLTIPYKSFRARLPTRYRPDMGIPMLLGRLVIRVLNPLLLGSGETSSANVTIFVRFPNSSFSGMINSDVGSVGGEMLPMTAALAMQYLFNKNSDNNRDKPPVQQSSHFFIPQATQSFCLGTNISEPINALRLDARGQTPHPEGSTDEMMVSHVCSRFGFLRSLEWKNEHSVGTRLFTFDASPMFNVAQYSNVVVNNNVCYYMPPVAVISNLFAFWRGELELRIDVVATQYHTGRLMVAYIPGYLGDITMCQARGSHYKVFDLHSDRQFSMIIPYVSDRPWWPRRYDAGLRIDEQPPPGRVVIFVHNQLVAMQNVHSSVFLNCYWRAGPTFEVSIPVQPSIGLSFNATSSSEKMEEAYAKQGYFPYYVGSWASFQGGTKPILRYGAVSQHIAQFMHLKSNLYYKPKNPKATLTFKNAKEEVVKANFLVPIDIGDGYGLIYMAVASSTKVLKDVYTEIKDGARIMRSSPDFSQLETLGDTSSNPWLPTDVGNATYVGTSVETLVNEIKLDDFLVDSEIGEITSSSNPSAILPSSSSTQGGLVTFGEVFNDLKSLCRRYELYSAHSTYINKTVKVGTVHIKIPLLIQGLDFDTNVSKIRNNLRDGVIPIVSSGYRFYRGGMRLRLVFNNPGCTGVWVAHRPERKLLSLTPLPSKSHSVDDIYNFGYAMIYQNLDINNTVHIEIPFYQPGSLGLLQRPYIFRDEINSHISLGDLAIGYHSEHDKTHSIECTTFYSIADDCRFSGFQGFPPMLLCRDIPYAPVSGEMGDDIPYPQYYIQFLSINNKIKAEMGCFNIFNYVRSQNSSNSDSTSFTEFCESDMVGNIIMIMSHVAQVFVHRTAISAFIGLCSVLSYLGFGHATDVWKMVAKFLNILKPWGVSPEQSIDTRVSPESYSEGSMAKDCATIVGTLFSAVCIAAHVPSMRIDSISSFTKVLTKCIADVSRGGFFVMKFLEGVFDLIGRMFRYIKNRLAPGKIFSYLHSNNNEIVVLWAREAYILLLPENEDKILTSANWFDRLDVTYHVGATIQSAAVVSDRSTREESLNASCIMALQNKLHNLRYKAQCVGRGTATRVEPFCIWVSGPAGIGKSHLASLIATSLLESVNFTYPGDPIFVYAATRSFMDGLRDQPIFLFDDFNCISGVDNEVFNTFMTLNSCATFIPNQAWLEDKGRRYAPKIIYVNSNHNFMNEGCIKDKTAFHRRRHLLVEANVVEGAIPAWQKLHQSDKPFSKSESAEIVKNLVFKIADNPASEQTSWSGLFKFEQFINKAKSYFRKHHENSTQAYLQRVENMAKLMPQPDIYLPLDDQIRELGEQLKSGKYNRALTDPLEKYLEILRKGKTDPSPPPTQNPLTSGEMGDSASECSEAIVQLVDSTLSTFPNQPCEFSAVANVAKDASAYSVDISDVDIEFVKCLLELGMSGGKFNWDACVRNCLDIYINNKNLEDVNLNTTFWQLFGVRNLDKREPELRELLQNYQYRIKDIVCTYFEQCYINASSCKQLDSTTDSRFIRCTVISEVNKFVVSRGYDSCKLVADYMDSLKLGIRTPPRRNSDVVIDPPPTECEVEVKKTRDNAVSVDFPPKGSTIFFLDWHRDFSLHKIDTFRHFYSNCIHTPQNMISLVFDPITKEFQDMSNSTFTILPCSKACIVKDTHNWYRFLVYLKSNYAPWTNFFEQEFKYLEKSKLKELLTIPAVIDANSKLVDQLTKPYKKSFIKTVWDKLFEFFSHHVVGVMTALAVIVTAVVGYKKRDTIIESVRSILPDSLVERYNKLKAKFKKDHTTMSREEVDEYIRLRGELQSSGDTNKVVRQARSTGITSKVLSGENGVGATLRHIESLINVIKRNTFFLRIEGLHRNTGMQVCEIGRCLGIGGNFVLIPYHYKLKLDLIANPTINVVMETLTVEISPNELKWRRMKDCELAIVKFPSTISGFKKLTNRFIFEYDAQINFPVDACFIEIDHLFSLSINQLDVQVTKEINMSNEGVVDKLVNVITYAHHAPGKCGSVIVDTRGNGCIIGMHVAGGSGIGVAEPLVRETFESMPILDFIYPADRLLSKSQAAVVLNNNFTPIGITKPELAHHELGKTAIVPSIIAGVFPVRTSPAPLSPKDPRVNFSPLLEGVEKHGKPILGFARSELKIVYKDYLHTILTVVKPLRNPIGVLPLSIACNGIDGNRTYKSLTLSTSEGFPYSSYRPSGYTNKKWLFDVKDDKIVGIHNMVTSTIEEKNELRKQGVVPPTVFIDCLKDARILNEKCSQPGKTRIFSISPIDYTIVFRQYFLDFIAAFMYHRFKSEHAVGISCDSIEWTYVGRRVTELGPCIVAGDYSNFGPSLDLECARHVGKVWRKWYKTHGTVTDDEDMVRKVLIAELCNSIHLVVNVLYRTHCGCPSGSPGTVIKNSGVNSLYIRLAWRYIFRDDPYMRTMDSFHRHVRLFTYGDDLLMNVSLEAIEKFNNRSLQAFFARHNLKYTDATKSDEVVPYLELNEVTFLKRGFASHPFRSHILLAGLDKIFLEDIANWIVKSPDRVAQSKESSVMCCMSAYGHGLQYFTYIRNKLLDAWMKTGHHIVLRDWEEMDDIFFSNRDLFADSAYFLFKDNKLPDYVVEFAKRNFFDSDIDT